MANIPREFYDKVAEELQAGPPQPGLWARAYSETEGIETKARARYIALRVTELYDEAKTNHAGVYRQQANERSATATFEKEARRQRDQQEAVARGSSMGRLAFLGWWLALSVFWVVMTHLFLSLKSIAGITESAYELRAAMLVVGSVVSFFWVGGLRAINIGHSAFAGLLLLIPLIGLVPLLYFLFAPPNYARRNVPLSDGGQAPMAAESSVPTQP